MNISNITTGISLIQITSSLEDKDDPSCFLNFFNGALAVSELKKITSEDMLYLS